MVFFFVKKAKNLKRVLDNGNDFRLVYTHVRAKVESEGTKSKIGNLYTPRLTRLSIFRRNTELSIWGVFLCKAMKSVRETFISQLF